MSWPHKDDGTVDWDTVFDAPDSGLVPYVERAQSLESLGSCAHIIVQSLFIREQDLAHRNAFNHMIDELLSSNDPGDLARVRKLVVSLVHAIKDNRVKHAQTYLDTGRSEQDEACRRTEHDPTEALKVLKQDGEPS